MLTTAKKRYLTIITKGKKKKHKVDQPCQRAQEILQSLENERQPGKPHGDSLPYNYLTNYHISSK